MNASENEPERELKKWNRRTTKRVRKIVEGSEPEAILEELFPECDGEAGSETQKKTPD